MNYKSSQQAARSAGRMLHTNELGGRQRVAYFSFTVPTGMVLADTVDLTELPKGARILRGHLVFEAMSTGAGTASVAIGPVAAQEQFLAASSVDTAGVLTFADTPARGYGTVLATDTLIRATVSGEAWAPGKTLAGHITYVVD